jgi:hypothetical protein
MKEDEMARHVACIGEMKNAYKILFLESLMGRGHSGDQGIDGRILLKLIFGKQGGRVWSGFMWPLAGSCEHCNESSVSIKGEECLD